MVTVKKHQVRYDVVGFHDEARSLATYSLPCTSQRLRELGSANGNNTSTANPGTEDALSEPLLASGDVAHPTDMGAVERRLNVRALLIAFRLILFLCKLTSNLSKDQNIIQIVHNFSILYCLNGTYNNAIFHTNGV